MIENIIFCFAFALQIFAWMLAGAGIGFRAGRKTVRREREIGAERKKPWYNTLLLRRLYLTVGAVIICIFAVLCHDYLLLAGQLILFAVLWFRVALVRD